MKYQITAKLKEGKSLDFREALQDGRVRGIGPDGVEIVKGLQNATIAKSGEVTWSMICFCSPPLKHEREAILDDYFTDMKIVPLDEAIPQSGESFLKHLDNL